MGERNVAERERQDTGNAEKGDKNTMGKRDRGLLRVDQNECKGCGLCVEACPPKAIRMGEELNHHGYRTASYAGAGCTGCGICFMICPEPGAITVMRLRKAAPVQTVTARIDVAQAGSLQAGSVARAS
jgi:Pyruvate/2-oxoacid:ferredoxin oxidoreductase delta subunit